MTGKYILVLGADSDIAKATIKKYAENGYNFYLAGRFLDELQKDAEDYMLRYKCEVEPVCFDALKYDEHKKFYDDLKEKPIGVICAFGYLGDQEKAQSDFNEAKMILDTNYTGCMSILEIIAADFEKRKEGFIIAISSVAGDRGRKSNYIYGSAKGALTVYLSGLRNRLFEAGVSVITVKPGFVATKMTEGLDIPEKLTAKPEEVANDIFKAQQKGKPIKYTKWFWKYIMLIIRYIPEKMFRKMSI